MADGGVVEVRGPAVPLAGVSALIGFGVLSLLVTGVLSELLGAMVDEGRITSAGLGYAATLEAWAMAIGVAVCSITLAPARLRTIGGGATIVLVAANLATMGSNGGAIYAARGIAGLAEGVMLWMASAMIVRTDTPERWSALLFLALSLVQLAVSGLLGAWILPHFGGDGGYALIALLSVAGFALALRSPSMLGPLPGTQGAGRGMPSVQGATGLIAVVLFTGATAAVSVYLVPIATGAGLSRPAAHVAVSAALGAQIIGSILATLIAGRVNYLGMLGMTTIGYLMVWAFYTVPAAPIPFIAMTAFGGLVAMFVSPFLLPMLIRADPSRRAALLAPAAQLLSGGLGPLIAAWTVDAHGITALLAISAAALAGGFIVMAILHRSRPRDIQGSQLR